MTPPATVDTQQLKDRTRFLARVEPFKGLPGAQLDDLARTIVERVVAAGETVLVESGVPGTELFVVREGTLEICTRKPWSP